MVLSRRLEGSASQSGPCSLLYSGASTEDVLQFSFVFESVAARGLDESESRSSFPVFLEMKLMSSFINLLFWMETFTIKAPAIRRSRKRF